MKLHEIDEPLEREATAKTILSYFEENHALVFDSARQEFSVIGLQSRPDYLMSRDALISLGATGCDNWEGRITVRKDQGGKQLATKLKELGLRFTGETDVVGTQRLK